MNLIKIMRIKILSISILLVILTAYSYGAVLEVPGDYSTINSAVNAAEDGDVIEIQAGTYSGSGIVSTISDDITIRGVNGIAHLNANGVTISNRKAIFVTTGDNITIENMEFSNAVVPDENGAGIRHEGGLLTIRNCSFHDNENGILTSGQSGGELYIENSEFNHNGLGRAGYTHNIYVGHISKFTIKSSYSHHATYGHNIKTRAAENHILYNRIMDETSGNASYQIDIPDGGYTYIIGNTIHQGEEAENSSMISYAAEHQNIGVLELYVTGNTFVNDRNSSTGIRIVGSPVTNITNNIFDNVSTAVSGNTTTFSNNIESSNNNFHNRSTFDFHLTSDSPALNQAEATGIVNGVSLTPVYEYLHSASSKTRLNDGSPDIGAFEFDDGTDTLNADFNISPSTSTGVAPLTVTFNDISTGTPETWSWDFNNDGIEDSSLRSPQYTYETQGNFTVALTITDSNGTDQITRQNAVTITSAEGDSTDPEQNDTTKSGDSGSSGCFLQTAYH